MIRSNKRVNMDRLFRYALILLCQIRGKRLIYKDLSISPILMLI